MCWAGSLRLLTHWGTAMLAVPQRNRNLDQSHTYSAARPMAVKGSVILAGFTTEVKLPSW